MRKIAVSSSFSSGTRFQYFSSLRLLPVVFPALLNSTADHRRARVSTASGDRDLALRVLFQVSRLKSLHNVVTNPANLFFVSI